MNFKFNKLKNTNETELKKFGFIMAIIIGLLFAILLPLIKSKPVNLYLLYTSFFFLTLAQISPRKLLYLYIIWMKLGGFLGEINTKIILTLIYILIFSPMALVFKLLKIDSMNRSFDKKRISYKITTNQNQKNMENPF